MNHFELNLRTMLMLSYLDELNLVSLNCVLDL